MIRSTRRIALAVGAVLVIAAGCGSDDEPTSATSTSTPTTASAPPDAPLATESSGSPATSVVTESSASPATSVAPASTSGSTAPLRPDLPETPISVVIEQSYAFDGSMPDATLLPVRPGEVTARWYRAGAVYAVVYDGLSPDAPACPGNSSQTTEGFGFISNAAVPGMACDDLPPIIDSTASQGVQVCGGLVSYLTLIPSDLIAALYASIERSTEGSGGVGLSGAVIVQDPTLVPEIDPAVLTC